MRIRLQKIEKKMHPIDDFFRLVCVTEILK